MKFLPITLVAALTTGFTEAKRIVNQAELNRRLKNGLVNKQTLMAGAKPANEFTKRKLEENAFQLDGTYSIQFNHCMSLSVQNEDIMNDENFVEMAANGDLVSEKDYIIFNVCETEYCSYYGEDEKLTFIADVGTYFQALSQYLPTKVQEYCEACEQNYNYCYALYSGQSYYPEGYEPQEAEEEEAEEENVEEEEQAEEGEDAEGEEEENAEENEEGRRRKLENAQIKFIDCKMCATYECLDFQQTSSNGYTDENGDYVEAGLDDAMEWLNGFSECAETYAYLDDYLLYSGLMCNADGNGVEIGLFLDEDCLMYTPKVAYKDVMQSQDETYYGMIYDVVRFTFTNDGIECYDPEVVWYNEVDYYYQQLNGQQEEQQQEEDNGEAPEAAEWCQQLIQQDAAVNLYDCNGYAPEENNGEEEGDDLVNNYDWYSYEIKAEDAEDMQAVCYVVTSSEGEHHTYYNTNNEALFDYKRNKGGSSSGMSAGGVAGIVILILVAVAAVAGAMFFLKKKDSGDKKKPLINDQGHMA